MIKMLEKLFALSLLSLFTTLASAEIINIDNAELARLAASGVPIIDIRTEGEWKSSGVIAGSKLITFFDASGRSDKPQWLAKAAAYAGPDKPVILICRSGNRTQAAAQFLSGPAGYKTVYNVSKGISGWVGEGRPLVPATPAMLGCAPGARC